MKIFRRPADVPRSARELGRPLFRPPGALAEADFLKACTQCGDCLPVCPKRALFLAPAARGVAAGTPMIDPWREPCWMCADTPCITACKPGALRRESPDTFPRIALARILTGQCLAYQDAICTSCVEKCPAPGALELVSGRPTVRADRCSGCGICQHVCPIPGKAIVMDEVTRPASSVPLDPFVR